MNASASDIQKDSMRKHWRLGHLRADELLQVLIFVLCVAAIGLGAIGCWIDHPALRETPMLVRGLLYVLAAGGLGCILYGTLVEPYRLTVNPVTLSSLRMGSTPVRIAHLTDLHVREWTRLEASLVEVLRFQRPDLILITGDCRAYPGSTVDLQRLMRDLNALAPTYASRGDLEMEDPDLTSALEGAGVVVLCNRSVEVSVGTSHLTLLGVDAGDEDALLALCAAAPADHFSVCLYHYPDFVPELDRLDCDLMLCGHTHGGQVRLPGVGALVSLSRAGTRFARGLFQAGGKAAVVSQGVGCEGFGLPRIRFLCPPEIVLIELRPVVA